MEPIRVSPRHLGQMRVDDFCPNVLAAAQFQDQLENS
jgi:hypothetical protein